MESYNCRPNFSSKAKYMHGMQWVLPPMGEGFHYFPSEKTRQLNLVEILLCKNVNPRETSLRVKVANPSRTSFSIRKFMHGMQLVLPLL